MSFPLSPSGRFPGFECYPAGLAPSRRAFLRAVAASAAGAAATGTLTGCDAAPGNAGGIAEPSAPSEAGEGLDPLPVFPDGGFAPDAVRIGFNENPLGPSPRALAAIAADGLATGNRYNYPDSVRDRIAAHHGTTREHVLVGCGSTEFLQFLPWGFLKPGTTSLVLPEDHLRVVRWGGRFHRRRGDSHPDGARRNAGPCGDAGRHPARHPDRVPREPQQPDRSPGVPRRHRRAGGGGPRGRDPHRGRGLRRVPARRRRGSGPRARRRAGHRRAHLLEGLRDGRPSRRLRDRLGPHVREGHRRVVG